MDRLGEYLGVPILRYICPACVAQLSLKISPNLAFKFSSLVNTIENDARFAVCHICFSAAVVTNFVAGPSSSSLARNIGSVSNFLVCVGKNGRK